MTMYQRSGLFINGARSGPVFIFEDAERIALEVTRKRCILRRNHDQDYDDRTLWKM